MKLDLADPEQLKVYFYGHYHERYEADLVQRLLTGDDVFWDVGANVGYFTLVAATALNHRGGIMAFEPGQNAYARLTENLALNPYQNIQTFPVAVSDREGEAVLHLAGDIADSSASLYPADGARRRPGGLPDGGSGPRARLRGPASPQPHQAGRRGGGTGGAARGPGAPGRLTPPVADGNGRKDPGGRGGQQSRGGALSSPATATGPRISAKAAGTPPPTWPPSRAATSSGSTPALPPTGSKRRACRCWVTIDNFPPAGDGGEKNTHPMRCRMGIDPLGLFSRQNHYDSDSPLILKNPPLTAALSPALAGRG